MLCYKTYSVPILLSILCLYFQTVTRVASTLSITTVAVTPTATPVTATATSKQVSATAAKPQSYVVKPIRRVETSDEPKVSFLVILFHPLAVLLEGNCEC